MSIAHAELKKNPSESSAKSPVERDILTLLRYLTNSPLTFKEIRRELLRSYSESEIQKGILTLLERGLIETVYPRGFEPGFRPSKHEK